MSAENFIDLDALLYWLVPPGFILTNEPWNFTNDADECGMCSQTWTGDSVFVHVETGQILCLECFDGYPWDETAEEPS
jgi:hypothetical protein